MSDLVPQPATAANIENVILILRGQRVMLDADLAALYGVPTKVFNQAIKRNRQRFPEDFLFQLTPNEKQQVVTNCDHLARLKFSPTAPYAFTEHGAVMAAMLLNSPRAVEMSIYVVRAFVRFRQALSTNSEIMKRLDYLERRVQKHDRALSNVFEAIRLLLAPPEPARRRVIGFKPK